MSTDSDQWDEAEAAREAEASKASFKVVKDQPTGDARYTWDEWQKFNAGLDPEPTPEMFVSEIGLLRPDLFLWVDYQADETTVRSDAVYINLNNVESVHTHSELEIRMVSGKTWTTGDSATMSRFWEQWEMI